LALDAVCLAGMPGCLRYARDFVDRRRVASFTEPGRSAQMKMNRLYAVESTPGLTEAAADHRLPLRASRVEGLARALAARLQIPVAGSADQTPPDVPAEWLAALVADLKAHEQSSLVIAGEGQPAIV